jgi:preprotein translocase subunit SecG
MLTTFILIVHVMVCLFMIFIVLIQSGKGAELGAAFGGSGQTLFGARGAATVLGKLTTGAAIVFMLTSLLLAVVTSKGSSVVTSGPVTTQRVDPNKNIPQAPGASGPIQGAQPSQQTAPVAPAAPTK